MHPIRKGPRNRSAERTRVPVIREKFTRTRPAILRRSVFSQVSVPLPPPRLYVTRSVGPVAICIRGVGGGGGKAAGFNAHASCIFKAPAWYSCTRKLNPNARLLVTLSLSLRFSRRLSLVELALSTSSRLDQARPLLRFSDVYTHLRPARSSLIENQNSGELVGEAIRRDSIRRSVQRRARVHIRRYNC